MPRPVSTSFAPRQSLNHALSARPIAPSRLVNQIGRIPAADGGRVASPGIQREPPLRRHLSGNSAKPQHDPLAAFVISTPKRLVALPRAPAFPNLHDSARQPAGLPKNLACSRLPNLPDARRCSKADRMSERTATWSAPSSPLPRRSSKRGTSSATGNIRNPIRQTRSRAPQGEPAARPCPDQPGHSVASQRISSAAPRRSRSDRTRPQNRIPRRTPSMADRTESRRFAHRSSRPEHS